MPRRVRHLQLPDANQELQSLNAALTTLNEQLRDALSRQRTTSNDLQNILYSTDVATLFLDTNLAVRFFTPATKSLFNVTSEDIGRPLAHLQSLASDSELVSDARAVMDHLAPIDRELQTADGIWFTRRIMPYRADDDGIEGVVITLTNITQSKHAAKLVNDFRREAERATLAKSRLLAVASHDLRQPLQTLALLQGLLAKAVSGDKAKQLVGRLGETLGTMTGMLNALLDINQIDAGTVHPERSRFAINDLLDELRNEFTFHAQAKKLELRVVRCGLTVETDRRLLEQMLRNLLSNALKYTMSGKILLGCRRKGALLSIEILDTGIGIADTEIQSIFDEFHQVDNTARERGGGLGLGLSIVRRLGKLLDHDVRVRSILGRGSSFAVEVALPCSGPDAPPEPVSTAKPEVIHRTANILIVDHDPEVRALLDQFLGDEGHSTAMTGDATMALKLIADGAIKPDLVLTDFNLPGAMDGVRLSARLRDLLGPKLAVIILTGDISTDTMQTVARQDFVQLNKPVKATELLATVQRLLAASN